MATKISLKISKMGKSMKHGLFKFPCFFRREYEEYQLGNENN